MQGVRDRQDGALKGLGNAAGQLFGSGRILMGVFQTLDLAGIPYCVTHSYQTYPYRIGSDVDCIVSACASAQQLAAIFHEDPSGCIGADLVRWRGFSFVFAERRTGHPTSFVVLDLAHDYEVGSLQFYSGSEIIVNRRRNDEFWVPTPDLEFGCTLVRRIAKFRLDERQCGDLSRLYRQDPDGCKYQLTRFWGGSSAALLASAAGSGDWRGVQRRLGQLRSDLRRRTLLRHPVQTLRSWCTHIRQRAASVWRPDGGITLAFLGPDGAGKSSVIAAVSSGLAGAFNRTQQFGFAPGLLSNLFRRPKSTNSQPHAATPRMAAISVARALGYWLLYYILIYPVAVRLALARSSLVMHDRHMVDALVDPRRYRYAGPAWPLHLVWRVVPRPDLIVLLDAPPEVLQSRKQEVPFARVGSTASGLSSAGGFPAERTSRRCGTLARSSG